MIRNCRYPHTRLCHLLKTKAYLEFARAMVVGALLVFSLPAYAETVNTTADLDKSSKTVAYIYSYPMLESMYRLAVEQDRKFGLQQGCNTRYNVLPYGVTVLQPIEFPDDKKHPVKGVWKFRYQIQRCGESKFYNAIFIASVKGETPPTSQSYYPGNPTAGMQLIYDAMFSAVTSALVKSGQKDCKEVDVFDMSVTVQAHDVVKDGTLFRGV